MTSIGQKGSLVIAGRGRGTAIQKEAEDPRPRLRHCADQTVATVDYGLAEIATSATIFSLFMI